MDTRHPARLIQPVPARSRLHAERHPNAVTAPPVHRASMVPVPWQGFWRSIGRGLRGLLSPRASGPQAQEAPWQTAARRRRLAFLALAALSTLLAAVLFGVAQPADGSPWLRGLHALLFVVLTTWVVTGFVTALMGAWVLVFGDPHALSAGAVRDHPMNRDARTAVIMPICHEDVATVFAGLRATCESLSATGHARQFDVFVLSDSADPDTIAAERQAWEALRAALVTPSGQPVLEVYYRLRRRRSHRKAGNVADFCRRWGRDYRYMVVLDADSVMSGTALTTLVKLMEAHPRAGIIQTATQAIGHQTLHARAQQFASRVTGRLFTLGMRFWQLGESHYWGHNAIIRVAPFMQHCALAPIPGTGGMAGGIMSHDFVEAALMRRAGHEVWLVSDLSGSYEQQPPDLLSELQRDRRWCQGNLQNARLMAEPGLHRVHRAMFAIGAMSYLSAPLWLVFLLAGTALLLSGTGLPDSTQVIFGSVGGLWAWTLCLLFLPRVLGLLAVLLKGEQQRFGGVVPLLASALLETMLAVAQAPVRMVAHTLFVAVALTGIRLDWKSPPREASGVAWDTALTRLGPLSLVVAALLLAAAWIQPLVLPWLLPVALPLLLAVPLTVATGDVALGAWARRRNALLIPEEAWSPAVLRRAWRHASRLALSAA
jgi:membrane glycosyltransferase